MWQAVGNVVIPCQAFPKLQPPAVLSDFATAWHKLGFLKTFSLTGHNWEQRRLNGKIINFNESDTGGSVSGFLCFL